MVSTPSGQRTIERKVIVTTPGQLEATRQVNICHRNQSLVIKILIFNHNLN